MKYAFYIGNFAKPQNSAAGKRVYVNSLLLAACGFEVLMIGTDPRNKGKVEPVSEHISYISFPNYGKSSGWKYYSWFKKYITAFPCKPDLLVRYGSPGLATFDYYIYKYAHKNNLPLIIDVVDWLQADSNNIFFNIIKTLDTWLEKTQFNKYGDGLIAISNYLRNYYVSYYKNNIILPPLVQSYTSNNFVNKIPQIIYAGSPFRKGQYVKNVHAIKDRIDLIVSAFCSLAAEGEKFTLHLVGLTKEEYLIAFPKHRKQLEVTPQIRFYAYKPMEQVHELMKQMDFSILLRERNRATTAGFPTKVVESMSLGIPVITTDTSDLSKYINSGKNGFFVNIDNAQNLSEELKNILRTSPEKRREMKLNLYKNQDFCYSNFTKTFKQFLSAVIAKGEK